MPEEAEMVYTRLRAKWGLAASAPSPVSPESLANMAQQIVSQPVPDLMAINVQRQQQSQAQRGTSMSQYAGGYSAPMAASPTEAIDSRRTSGTPSMPPQSTADLSRDSRRIRASTYLTKAQQDAWNAHQARIAANAAATSSNQAGTAGDQNAARLFGGVESLIEETQDWFFKDQNQLAVGFENWGSEPPDWGTLDLSFFDTPETGSSTNANTNGNSPSYNGLQYSYDSGGGDGGTNPGVVTSQAGYGFGLTGDRYPTTTDTDIDGFPTNGTNGMNGLMGPGMSLQLGMNMDTSGNGSLATGMGLGMGGPGASKRSSQIQGFDDEAYY
ncbi:putative phospholipid-transporting ATPase NEO1 [Fonsecaea monophora]|uniref:Putative phospholipid-transporting ATPase NEO1 n=1 Tax=Fonsecaea monophora TaxID=254056 RepID=A0A177FJS7_9EURO|nr:putative phospholipid-transporting ATPase NEO1 [Fonsecaea monophora]KAH0847546.1 hypothetical protein FOPE_00848 [Fonsecaea pedrosoi]OAG44455.1 putative phospholipid-transporting ATPase NEO1 [Fonsecaea monophora]